MNVLFVGPVPPIQGGISQHSARLVGAMQSVGHNVETVTWRSQYPRWIYKGEQPNKQARFATGVRPILKWYSPSSWWLARRMANTVDLVVAQWVHPFHALAVRSFLGGARGASVVVVHNAQPHESFPFADPATRFALRRAGRFVAHSQTEADVLAMILRRADVAVTPLPPNLSIRPQQPAQRPPWRLLFTGYVRSYKGPDVAIEAMRYLPEQFPAVLTIAGSFWHQYEDLRALVDRHDLSERVVMLDRYLSDREMADMIADHHMVLAPYRSASQSGVIPLSLAAGRPVIASRVGGLAEQVPDGAGALVEPDHPKALAAAVLAVAERYDAACAAAAGGAPSWEVAVDTIVGEAP